MFRKSSSSNISSASATLAAVAVVQFAVSLDLSVVNVALPRIADGLGFTDAAVTWVIHAYALAFGGFLLLGGKAADMFGRRRMLLVGLAVFAAASLVGGLAQTPWHLLAARALQGVGAAAAAPAALAQLTSAFPSGAARARAFAVWGAVNAAGGAMGVVVGGLLTEYAGWRWIMFINVPMALAAMLLAALLPRDEGSRQGRPDVLGAILATTGVGALVFAIVRTDTAPVASAETIGVLTAAAVLLALFVLVERRTRRDPLVRLGLFRLRSVSGANLYNLLLGAAMSGAFYLLSMQIQRVMGAGPAAAGAMFLPFALGVVAGAAIGGRLQSRLTPRDLLVIGAVLAGLGFCWFTGAGASATFVGNVLGPSLVTSVGFGLALGPVVSTATAEAPPRDAGMASGLLNTSRQIGASLGLAVIGAVAHARVDPASSAQEIAVGHASGFAVCALLLFACAGIALVLIPRTIHRTPTADTPPSERKES
ncbi:MFS transporter [Microbacterium paludicola]|uniref:MFS transporter n=1 Tax=Microbacterium paludicola TaxID=300019 RepID=UPI00119E3A5C|nr:MFS transporter [Microbacterium paludicola]